MNKDTSFVDLDNLDSKEIYNVSSNLSNEETKEQSKHYFKLSNEESKETNLTNRKGRKTKKEKDSIDFSRRKRYHGNSHKDNVILKIKTHFKNKFLIRFLNHLVFEQFKRQKMAFRYFTYDIKNKKNMKAFMEKTIYEICRLEISQKYKNYSDDHNLKTLNKIQNEEIKNWKIKDLYTNYYLCENLNDVIPSNKNKKVESLYDFSQKAENEKLKKQIEKTGKTLISEYINLKNTININEENQENNNFENDNTINYNNITNKSIHYSENQNSKRFNDIHPTLIKKVENEDYLLKDNIKNEIILNEEQNKKNLNDNNIKNEEILNTVNILNTNSINTNYKRNEFNIIYDTFENEERINDRDIEIDTLYFSNENFCYY